MAIKGIPFLFDKGRIFEKKSISSDLFVFCTSIKKSFLKTDKKSSTFFSISLILFCLDSSKIWLSFPPEITTILSLKFFKSLKLIIGVW